MWLYLVSAWLVHLARGGTWCGPGKDDPPAGLQEPSTKFLSIFPARGQGHQKSFDLGAATQKTHLIALFDVLYPHVSCSAWSKGSIPSHPKF